MLNFKILIMDDLITILYIASPIVFFIGIFNIFLKKENLKVNLIIFGINFLVIIFLFSKLNGGVEQVILFGIIGLIAFIFALGGIINYFRNSSLSKEQKINFAIYLIICLIIGFGMCSTTGIFGF